ncbi:ATP-binding protein [Agromyces sp. MMS24-K17]|uniref:ATP-binding protein n=1 Tax=Agromyces sp. MMS24-K17 TaxID=3372850 RepID=UPI003754121E
MLIDHRGIRVALLGPVLVEGRDGVLAEPPGVLAKALLATLAGADGRAVDRTHGVDGIVDEIWGDEPPRNRKQALQTLVSRLRTTCSEGLVASRPGGYALALAPEATDVGLAHALGRDAAAHARDGDHEAAIGCLDRALVLWRGEPGLDLGAAPAGAALAEATAALRVGLRELRARCLLDAGDAAAAVAELEPLAAAHPLDEHLQHTRLRALAAAGRRTDAIAAFATFRSALRDDLGISPGPALVALHADLLRADATGEASGPPPGSRPSEAARRPDPFERAMPRTRIGVRAAPNPLIGRVDDVRHVEALLAQHRLVTILGTGGLGKTRLAQEVAARSDAPAVVVVELASIRADADVVLALASTLGIREASAAGSRLGELARRPDLRDRIVEKLAERPTLLVVDNCEQVVEGAASWVADLLGAVPGLRVLATSRSPLEIGAERTYRLDPLSATADGDGSGRGRGRPDGAEAGLGPAVELFVERARAARPGAALPRAAIGRLCERLDGLPLAIELAAARIRSMGVEQIEARLGDRFALLAGGDRSAPERQRTLLAVIEWSWALLTPAERLALPRLAWFVDGFTLEAAESVLDDPAAVDVLDGLIAQSLLSVADGSPADAGAGAQAAAAAAPRYRMLETVREFGQSRLGDDEREAVLGAVDRWARDFSEHALTTLRGPGQIAGLARTSAEQDNLVAVLRRAIERRDAATILPVFSCLGYFWTVRSAHSEIIAFSGPVLDATRGFRPTAADATAATLAFTLIGGTNLAVFTSTGLRALARLRAVARLGLPLPPWLEAIGGFILAAPDLALAKERMDAMAESDDPETALLANVLRTQFAENAGEPEAARADGQRAYALATELGDTWAQAMSALLLAELDAQDGDAEGTLRWARRSRTSLLAIGASEDVRQVDWRIATALLTSGRYAEAAERFDALSEADPSFPDGVELSKMTGLGRAELARLDGRLGEAVVLAREVVDGYVDSKIRSSPWFLLTLAGFIAGGARSGWPEADLARWASTLRRQATATMRARPGFVDRPVLGTVAVGWSAWAAGHPPLADRAAELFALAEALRSRQDLPSLARASIEETVVAGVGRAALAAARARVAAMSPDEQTERARALLAEPVPSE